ncbi:MAG: ABC transporter ATP-binding protein [Chloroflexota bacterium]
MSGQFDEAAPLPVIVAENVSVAFDDQVALRSVSLCVNVGERVLIQGHNGAGKSTLIRILAGLLRPDRGTVSIGGGSPTDRHIRRQIGVVIHNPWLDPDLTVTETLHYFGTLYGLQKFEERIEMLLARVGMLDRRHQRTGELSRGFQQRLTLTRALLHDPAILLLDEPDTGLDDDTLKSICEVLLDRSARPMRTIVLTSHNRAFGAAVAERTVVLVEGRAVEPYTLTC